MAPGATRLGYCGGSVEGGNFALTRALPCFTYFGRPSSRSYGRTALGMPLQ